MLNNGKKSRRSKKRLPKRKIEELVLIASKLMFSTEQLQNLNYIFQKKIGEDASLQEADPNIILARSVTERLVQRLMCGVGNRDMKFASKFLINLHDNQDKSTDLQYLIRLDALSRPGIYRNESPPKYSIIENDPDFPKGYARIRMFSSLYKVWGDYANQQGYLRRDKIQARYVELLASAAASESPSSPTNLDESYLCASPGKVVDACTFRNIANLPPVEHVFYGANGGAPRYPDPRDFRLAIVDEPDGIRLRVEFLSPALSSICMNVRLLIAVEGDSWPASTDFPSRIPLGHPDSLLYQTAAQTGVYFVGYGVQSSGWQMRFPAAEDTILRNYGPNSTVRNILKITGKILDEIYTDSERHQKYQFAYRILNNYVFKTCLFYELEKDFNSPTTVLLNWSPQTLSVHILKILDNLVFSLRRQKQPNYFFPTANLLANPGHLCEDDYFYDSKKIIAYLVKLHNLGNVSTAGNVEFDRMLLAEDLEMLLLCKWKELIDGLIPPGSTRGRRFCFAGSKSRREVAFTQYTARQLEYIALLLKNVINVKKNILMPVDEHWDDFDALKHNSDENNATEDIVYILLTIIDQAKDHYLKNNPDKKFKQKLATHFDPTILRLVELVRKAADTVLDDVDFVKIILKWLYRALDQNKRLLAPLLRPYLSILFISSHGNSWFLESIRKRLQSDEVGALGAFARLVNDGKISPALGLVDSVNKNWNWAKQMLKIIERENLRVVFVPGRGRIGRHIMSAPKNENERKNDPIKEEIHFSTLPKKNYFCTVLKNDLNQSDNKIPWHCVLRDNSPMTRIFEQVHRNGDHRCGGDIVQTLLSMQKLNILQDISSILPEEDRVQLLELVHKFSNEKKKNTIKRRSNTLPNISRSSEYAADTYQKYTQKEESAGVRVGRRRSRRGDSKGILKINTLEMRGVSLIDSCRAARMLEDSNYSYDNGNIKTLIRSKESFKK